MSILTTSLPIADVVGQLLAGDIPFRFTAYDGSAIGPDDAEYGMELSARLLREQLLKSMGAQAPSASGLPRSETYPTFPREPAEPQARRNVYSMDTPSRWR